MERFRQTKPKILVTVDAVHYNGKVHSLLQKTEEIAKQLESVEKVVIIPFVEKSCEQFSSSLPW